MGMYYRIHEIYDCKENEKNDYRQKIFKMIFVLNGKERIMSYEVFISYKYSDECGKRTKDFAIAEELYNVLTSHGYNVFFSSNF